MNKISICLFVMCLLCYGCNIKDSSSVSEDYKSSKTEESKIYGEKNASDNKSRKQFTNSAKAAKIMDERRIYLIDLTRSMEGFNGSENIFDKVKEQLHNTVVSMNDTSSEIFMVPFTDRPHGIYSEKIAKKDSILNYIAKLETKRGDTNILDAWRLGESLLDSTKINYMLMLTDGIHNCGNPIDSLYKTLNNWYDKTKGKYQFSFYVLLSQNAKEQEICRIVESSKQMWLVPSMNIQTDFIIGNMNLSVNIINNNKVKLHLTCTRPEVFNQGFRFNISIPKNDYYKIINASHDIDENGNISFEIDKLKPQKELPTSFKTKILIDYNREKYPFVFFTPEEYNLNIVNVGTRIVTVNMLEQ